MEYSNRKDEKLHKGSYSWFFPKRKNGTFEWYYPNGKIRKQVTYENDQITGLTKRFHSNGNVHYLLKDDLYEDVYDDEGHQVLNNEGDGSETLYDATMNRDITRVYRKNELVSTFFVD